LLFSLRLYNFKTLFHAAVRFTAASLPAETNRRFHLIERQERRAAFLGSASRFCHSDNLKPEEVYIGMRLKKVWSFVSVAFLVFFL